VAKRRANTRTESAKIRNRRTLKKVCFINNCKKKNVLPFDAWLFVNLNGCVCLESILFLGDHFKYIRGSDIMRKEVMFPIDMHFAD
jgi:hypothetical protein